LLTGHPFPVRLHRAAVPHAAEAAPGSGDQGGSAASGGASGAKPTLNVWYHQYGEAGTQQAVMRYARNIPTPR
jgi:multiple sugar transport system substrate-binding protein